jgi:hypothetical protein
VPAAMRGPGADYRAVALAWRAFFRPPDRTAAVERGFDRLAREGQRSRV